MPIYLWTGGEDRETTGLLHGMPYSDYRNQVDLVDGSGSMHTCNGTRLKGAHTGS